MLYVIRQANQLTIRSLDLTIEGRVREGDPSPEVAPGEVLVLQPYGSLFFASAQTFEDALPVVTDATRHAVVILRLRGTGDIGITVVEALRRYATRLAEHDSRLMIVTDSTQTLTQLTSSGATEDIGDDNLRLGTAWQFDALRDAHADACAWIEERA